MGKCAIELKSVLISFSVLFDFLNIKHIDFICSWNLQNCNSQGLTSWEGLTTSIT